MTRRSHLVAASLFLLAAGPAIAASPLTFVSGNGQDTGACTRVAPCRTFAYALTQTTSGGFLVAIDPAAYGSMRITQSVTIIGPGKGGAGLVPNGVKNNNTGVDIEAPGATVILRGLEVDNGYDGILVGQAATVVISDTVIIGSSNLAINVVDTGATVFVQDTTVENAEPRSGAANFVAKRLTVFGSPSNAFSVLTGRTVLDDCTLSRGGNVGFSVFSGTAFIKHGIIPFTGLRGISVAGGSTGYVDTTTTFGSGQIGVSNAESTIYSYGNNNFPDGTNGTVTPIAGD